MKNSKRAIQMMAVVAAVACSTAAASASVTYTINNGGLESFNVVIDGTSINGALAGGILITQNTPPPINSSMPLSYVTLCTDIEGTLYLGQSYQYATPTTPFSGQTGVNPTWGAINTPAYLASHGNTAVAANAAQAIQNAAHLFYTYGQLTSTGLGGNPDQMAALQLAVWEALYDTTANGSVTGTRFTWSGGDATVLSDVNSWLSGLTGDYKLTGYLLSPAQGGGVNADGEPPQELFIAVPVPESPTVIAGALLLLPFAASTFKILRKTRRV